MEEICAIDPNLPEVEIVYELLKSSDDRQSKKLRDLLEQAFLIKGIALDNHQKMAAVHTEIILDNRFASTGKGIWGLREWTREKIVRRTVSRAGLNAYPFRRRSIFTEIEEEEQASANKHNKNNDGTNFLDEEEWEE